MKYIVLILIFACSCTERITFEVPSDEELYVVYGLLTNENKHQEIEFGNAVDYSLESFFQRAIRPISNAIVTVETSGGSFFSFKESDIEPGHYFSESKFACKPEIKYKLIIESDDEIIIESEWETIKPPVEIKNSHTEKVTTDYIKNGIKLEQKGLNLSINFTDDINDENYYYTRWNGIFYVPNSSNGRTCWKRESDINEINLITDNQHYTSSITHKVKYIEINKERLGGRKYVSVISLYNLNEGSYKYFSDIKTNRIQGSIFDQTPSKINSNLSSNEILVSGYFHLAPVSVFRVITNEVLAVNYNLTCGDPEIWPFVRCTDCDRFDLYEQPPDW